MPDDTGQDLAPEEHGPVLGVVYAVGPNRWVRAELFDRERAERCVDAICAAYVAQGGLRTDIREAVRLEVNTGTSPVVTRLLLDGRVVGHEHVDFPAGVWLEGIAADICTFASLSDLRPDLVPDLLDRYVKGLMGLARIRDQHSTAVRQSLDLEYTTDMEPRVVRATSRLAGDARWLDWDGSTEMLISFVHQLAEDHADWLEDEREIGGYTEWDS